MSAAGVPPPVPKRLVVSTYRQLLRLTLRFDTDPAFRALVCVSPAAVYSGELGCWRGLARNNADVAPAEQYLEDVLRFSNQTSDFHIADPTQMTPRSWRTARLLYPEHRFRPPQPERPGNQFDQQQQQQPVAAAQSAEAFRFFPLSYIARIHFRGGQELQQCKTEMQAAVTEAHLRRVSNAGAAAAAAASGAPAAAASSAASASAAAPGNKSALESATAPPSAAQLGAAFHCVRWLKNLITVVRTDHPTLGTACAHVAQSELFRPAGSTDELGALQLLPCYRAPHRRRWRLGPEESEEQQQQPPSSLSAEAAEQGFLGTMEEDAAASAASAASAAASREAKGGKKGKKKASTAAQAEDEAAAAAVAAVEPPEGQALGKMSGKEAARRLMEMRSRRVAEAKAARSRMLEDEAGRFAFATQLVHRPFAEAETGTEWTDVPVRVTGHAPSAFFLAAHPVMPGFFLGNVLLMHHVDPNQGAVGFTINRPLRNNDGVPVPVWAVFAQEGQPTTATLLRHLEDNRIFVAGPVSVAPPPLPVPGAPLSGSTGSSSAGGSGAGSSSGASLREQEFLSVAHFLHRIPGVPHAQPVAPGVWWSGDQRVIGQKLDSGEASPRDVMVLIGHSGWGAQQLEGEIANGSWLAAVSRSPADDKLFQELAAQTAAEGEAVRPFASPRSSTTSSGGASDVAEGKSSKQQPQEGGDAEAATATVAALPTRFDSVADFIFAGNVPVSKEEKVETMKKDPDCLVHIWRHFVRRLGAPGLTRLAELSPSGDWMSTGDAKDGGVKPTSPGAAARARAAGGATGATGGSPGGSAGKPSV